MASKIEVANPDIVSMKGSFSWGLRVKEVQEWYYISGQVDIKADWQIGHPGDPVGQTRAVFKNLDMLRNLLPVLGNKVSRTKGNLVEIKPLPETCHNQLIALL